MKTITHLLFAIIIFGLLPAVNAQKKSNKNPKTENNQKLIKFIEVNDSSYINYEVIKLIRDEANRRFTDPKAPRFVLIDQQGKFSMGIGGFVKVTGSYGFDNIIPQSNGYAFGPYQIPVNNKPFSKGQYMFSASTSEIFLKMVGKTKALGNISTYISFNFTGPGGAPILRQAYVKLGGFTIGQAWNTLSDLNSCPPTIDYQSPNGLAGFRNPLIRYTHSFKKHWEFAVAAELPGAEITTNNDQSSVTQVAPDLAGYFQYGWNEGNSHIRLSGLMRFLSYRNNIAEKNNTEIGWGAQLSGLIAITKKLTFYYQFLGGKGISTYINDLSYLNLDLVPNMAKPGNMNMLYMNGWYLGLQYNFTPNIFASATYSQANAYYGNYTTPDLYKTGQYIVANVFWNVTADCQLGIEYLYGSRKNFDNSYGHANRINLMVQYNF